MDWDDRLGDLRWGGLVSYDGWTYRFNATDAMWAVRMLLGETVSGADGPEGDAVLWCMANRMYLLRNVTYARKDGLLLVPPHSYTDIIRSYSQPINPYWFNPMHESDAGTMQRRREVISLGPADTWRGVRVEDVTRKVVAFMQGRIPNPVPGIVHFGEANNATFVEQHGMPTPLPFETSNWFWRSPATRMWNEGTLNPTPPQPASLATPLLVGLSGLALYILLVKLTGSKTLGLVALLPP